MASASRLVTLSRALARAPSSAVHTAGLRAFANAASRAGKGGSANASATAAGGKGRASAALSHEISVESLQQEFEHSSSSEEVVAAERGESLIACKEHTGAMCSHRLVGC